MAKVKTADWPGLTVVTSVVAYSMGVSGLTTQSASSPATFGGQHIARSTWVELPLTHATVPVFMKQPPICSVSPPCTCGVVDSPQATAENPGVGRASNAAVT